MQGTTVKCTIVLLTDLPTTKTVYIAAELPTPSGRTPTEILRLFLTDPATPHDRTTAMITVVVKGIELPLERIETLVTAFLAERRQNKAPYTFEIGDEALSDSQARKSKMNSTLSSRPPKAI